MSTLFHICPKLKFMVCAHSLVSINAWGPTIARSAVNVENRRKYKQNLIKYLARFVAIAISDAPKWREKSANGKSRARSANHSICTIQWHEWHIGPWHLLDELLLPLHTMIRVKHKNRRKLCHVPSEKRERNIYISDRKVTERDNSISRFDGRACARKS